MKAKSFSEAGASLLEHSLLITLIALAAFSAIRFFGLLPSASFAKVSVGIRNDCQEVAGSVSIAPGGTVWTFSCVESSGARHVVSSIKVGTNLSEDQYPKLINEYTRINCYSKSKISVHGSAEACIQNSTM